MLSKFRTVLLIVLSLSIPIWASFTQSELIRFNSPDLYVRLGVARDAPDETIKREYRKLAQKYHPDRNKDREQEAEEIFKKISEAYSLLSDRIKRSEYDRVLNEGFRKPAEKPSVQQSPGVFDRARRDLEELSALFPNLEGLVFSVLRRDIYPNMSAQIKVEEVSERLRKYEPIFYSRYKSELSAVIRKDFYWLPFEQIHVWPSDSAIARSVIATRNPYLIRELMASLVNLPGWNEHESILQEVISLNIPLVNEYIAEFLHMPQWVNPVGARLLERLIHLGYSDQVARSLGLAGSTIYVDAQGRRAQSKGWYELAEGLYLMKLLFQKADDRTLRRVESFYLVDRTDPWARALSALPEFRDLPYLGIRTMKPIVQSLKLDGIPKQLALENKCSSVHAR